MKDGSDVNIALIYKFYKGIENLFFVLFRIDIIKGR